MNTPIPWEPGPTLHRVNLTPTPHTLYNVPHYTFYNVHWTRPKPMRKLNDKLEMIGTVNLPPQLAKDVRDLLRDPVTKRTRYRAFNNLCHMLFSNWVEQQRLNPSTPPDPEDL